ncbi:L,D-transpeptidase family protein [Patescibacteria group bacterium]|nr:L,D-transpeptidase family protein [Patescibacteria group bacterium]
MSAFFVSAGIFVYEQKFEKDILFIYSKIKFSDIELLKKALKKDEPVFLESFEDIGRKNITNKTDFLQVDLTDMEISLYKSGLLIKRVPIITKGDVDNWGGSAAGLYRILSGNKASYSNTSDVYMPYALHYYGKYYIHGIPYYPGGLKLNSSFSGGCLRLNDKDAEDIYNLSNLNMSVLVIDKKKDNYEYLRENKTDFPDLLSQNYLIADLDSGYVFAEKDSSMPVPIASLTKLMTALIVAENINLERFIFINEKMIEDGYGITDILEVGKGFQVVELFYPLLIESSNDAAEALSYFLGREKTIRLMNEKARNILMEQTKFTDPSGIDAGNISTTRDLFNLVRYIFNNRSPILEITKGNKVRSFGVVSFDINKLWNKNIFISDTTFIGGKTGYIKESKDTATFLFQFTDKDEVKRNIAFIFLGSLNIKIDTQRTYKWLLKNYFVVK